ncbi:MAG: hypothetical protein J0M09_03895 [Xanthomonadales bacterium]|nr:hypothetical protein [Xanthomonadales bacterium]
MPSFRFLRPLLLSLALLCAGPVAAAELTVDMPPEQVAREAYRRMQTADWVAAAETFDPAALKRFRELLLPVLDVVGVAGKDRADQEQDNEQDKASAGALMLWVLFAPATSVEEIKALSDREVFARIMANTMSLASAKLEGQDVIGSVAEGSDMVHVVTRNVAKVEAMTMTKVEAITLHRTPHGWRLALTGDLEGLAETLQASIAPPQDPAAGDDSPSP